MKTKQKQALRKRIRKTKQDLRALWRAGHPISCAIIGPSVGLNHKDLIREESKSIARAVRRGKGFKKRSNGNYSRLCDECGEPRGDMWIVDTDVWKAVMPEERWADDICEGCWHKLLRTK
jgi:hypothetical protein